MLGVPASILRCSPRSFLLMCSIVRPGDWTCGECGASPVFASKTSCFRCGAPRPESAGPAVGRQFESASRTGDWTCDECGAFPVFASRDTCFRCGAPRGGSDDGGEAQYEHAAAPEFRSDFQRTRAFVENLSLDTDWMSLKDLFSREGYPIVYASVSTDASGQSKGHGIVQFETVHATQHAIEHMTGAVLDGNDLNVRPDFQEGKRRRPSSGGGDRSQRPPNAPGVYKRVGDSADLDVGRVEALLVEREALRKRRDFVGADEIRDDLREVFGVTVDDKDRMWYVGERRPVSARDMGNEAPAWMTKAWERVAGSDDELVVEHFDEASVVELLAERDAAREARDFETADRLYMKLTVSVHKLSLSVHKGTGAGTGCGCRRATRQSLI